jgi:arsenite methyltransferase
MQHPNDHRARIRDQYGRWAKAGAAPSTQGQSGRLDPVEKAKSIGYTDAQLASVPAGAVMGLGCGNPAALAGLQPGQSVLDIGCGGGLDAFLAARAVGKTGRVFGVDPTPEMIQKAEENARRDDYPNLQFKQGSVERLPLADDSIDVVISNCVINHCTDKLSAFREIHRVLRPGGKMCIADLVVIGPIPQDLLQDLLWGAWLAAASGRQEYLDAIDKARFRNVAVSSQGLFGTAQADPRLAGKIESLQITAYK